MKYCLDYSRRSRVLNIIDEINVFIDGTDMITIIDFIQKHTAQRINLKLKDKEQIFEYKLIEKFAQLSKEYKEFNLAIVLPKYEEEYITTLKRCGSEVRFFFDQVVRDWETFNQYIELGVSDIYVVEQLGFEIKNVAKVAHDRGVRIRTFPNIAQRMWDATPVMKSFFIRPEDVKYYEGYIDVLELYSGEHLNMDVLYDIYTNMKVWNGQLNEIILGLTSPIDSRFIMPRFAQRRLNCERKCLKGGNCNMCETIEKLSKNLKLAGFTITADGKERDINGKRSDS